MGASGALGLPDMQAVAVELDILPAQAIDLLAPQARVERERVRNPILESQRGEQLLGLLERCDTRTRLLVVRRQLDSTNRIARDEPTRWARRPTLDGAHHWRPLTSQLVEEGGDVALDDRSALPPSCDSRWQR
jgi:hypothetical protein